MIYIEDFVAKQKGYGSIELTWSFVDAATPSWTNFKLLRNSFGYPVSDTDGEEVYSGDVLDLETYIDSSIKEGRYYYYKIFFLTNDATPAWVSTDSAAIKCFALKDYGYAETLYNLLPSVYREYDEKLDEIVPGTSAKELYKFLQIFAEGFSDVRVRYDFLSKAYNISELPSQYLKDMCSMLGWPYEKALGDLLIRRQLSTALWLYRKKGTRVGIETLCEVITGWDAAVKEFGLSIFYWYDGIMLDDDPNLSLTLDTTDIDLVAQMGSPTDTVKYLYSYESGTGGTLTEFKVYLGIQEDVRQDMKLSRLRAHLDLYKPSPSSYKLYDSANPSIELT
jgi:phage tail-like protein